MANTTLHPNITLNKVIERAMEAELAAGASGSGRAREKEEGANNGGQAPAAQERVTAARRCHNTRSEKILTNGEATEGIECDA
jgi:hypothetical protein